jgi:hypothetical protein
MTEWHWAGPFAPKDMAGRTPPCGAHRELAVLGGAGEHLCRVCLNCGYGWTEACVSHGAVPRRVPEPSSAADALFSLASGAASTGVASLLGLLFSGTARVAVWLAVTVALSVIAGIGYAVLTGRGGDDVMKASRKGALPVSGVTTTGRTEAPRVFTDPRNHFRRLFPAAFRDSRGRRS